MSLNISTGFKIYQPDVTKPLVAPDIDGFSITGEAYEGYETAEAIPASALLTTGDKIWVKVGTWGQLINGIPFAKFTDWKESTALGAGQGQFKIIVDTATSLITTPILGITFMFKFSETAPNSATRMKSVTVQKHVLRLGEIPATVSFIVDRNIYGWGSELSGSSALAVSNESSAVLQYSCNPIDMSCPLHDDGVTQDISVTNHSYPSDGITNTFLSGRGQMQKYSFTPTDTLQQAFVERYFLGYSQYEKGKSTLTNSSKQTYFALDFDQDEHLTSYNPSANRVFIPCAAMQTTENFSRSRKVTAFDTITITQSSRLTTFGNFLSESES